MNFTDEQQQAIYTLNRDVIVFAGAGSGKTRVLVERYLALLDAHPDWPLGALVAITFTRKAAEEMRDRVRRELETRAPERLAQIDTMRIDTIHGMCAALLRANAAEAGIDPAFTVLDEVEAAILRDDVIEAVLTDLVAENDPALELVVEYDLLNLRAVLAGPMLPTALPDDLLAYWRSLWEDSMQAGRESFLRLVDEVGTSQPPAEDKLGTHWQNCLDALNLLADGDAPTCLEALKVFAEVKLNVGSKSRWGSAEALAEAKSQLKLLREAAGDIIKTVGEPPSELDARAAELLQWWAALIERMETAYRAAKASNGWLDFDDLETHTRDLLRQYPHVAERYRGREFQHLLVDEFQDTNAVQWDIVRALADSLFVVGDPKQSIYAFRGADVSVFNRVRRDIEDDGGVAVPLSQSFRTHAPLVGCFNRLFDTLLMRDDLSPVADFQVTLGKPMTAYRQDPPDTTAALELILIDRYDGDERINAEDRRHWEAYEIGLRLRQMVEGGQQVFDRETNMTRPIQYGDVAMLFQSLNPVEIYEDALKTLGIPYVTVAGRGYYNRQEVWDVLNLLSAVHNRADDLALAAALRSPLFSLSDDALLALRLTRDSEDNPATLWNALDQASDLLPADEVGRVRFARDTLYELQAMAGRVTISDLLRRALALTGYLAVLTGLPDGARRRGNVEKLLEKAETTGKVTLGAFSAYLREMSAREIREGEAPVETSGAVTLMSVHASKGLEYPLVVLTDASWERSNRGGLPLVHDPLVGLACRVYDGESLADTVAYRLARDLAGQRDAAERLRLLYVAMTRAQDRVIIAGQAQMDDNGWTSRGWLGQLLDAMQPDGAAEFPYADVTVRLHAPQQRPDRQTPVPEAVDREYAPTDPPTEPVLLQPLPLPLDGAVYHLAASQIADLGGMELADNEDERLFHWKRFLHDAPAQVEPVSDQHKTVTARSIGEIVHEALRYWRLSESGEDAMLRSYAWRHGITDSGQLDEAVRRSAGLLRRFRQSPMFRRIDTAVQVYRELPFIYSVDGYIIHGIIDVLFQEPDGHWVLVDYKTSAVSGQEFERHSRRYHLQVGIYAEAAAAQLEGVVPEVNIHYIRYTQTVTVSESQWRAALAHRLPERIKRALTR